MSETSNNISNKFSMGSRLQFGAIFHEEEIRFKNN